MIVKCKCALLKEQEMDKKSEFKAIMQKLDSNAFFEMREQLYNQSLF